MGGEMVVVWFITDCIPPKLSSETNLCCVTTDVVKIWALNRLDNKKSLICPKAREFIASGGEITDSIPSCWNELIMEFEREVSRIQRLALSEPNSPRVFTRTGGNNRIILLACPSKNIPKGFKCFTL